MALNGHPEIALILGDASALAGVPECDVFIANINRNVITADIAAYAARLRRGGTMLLSGFYTDDIPVVAGAAGAAGLKVDSWTELDRWTCLKLTRI